jgi:hypothetical protein
VINRRSVPALHRTCLHQRWQPEQESGGILCQEPLKTDMTAEHNAIDQEHLRKIVQGELVTQTPEHHESDDVAGIVRPVQRASTPLVELLAASATPEPAVTLSGALAPFRNGRRAAPNALSTYPASLAAALSHTRHNRIGIVAQTRDQLTPAVQ